MKTQIQNLALALIASIAFNVSAAPLAKLVVDGGMPGPGSLAKATITINDDGTVTKDAFYNNEDWDSSEPGKEFHGVVGQLNAQDLQLIMANVSQLKGGAFKTSNEPGCEDAPGYTYSVINSGGEIEIFRTWACIDYPPKSHRNRARASVIKTYLDLFDVY